MLDSIESAIEAIKNGKLVIVVDDEDRENEGDFIAAAQTITPEIINFMSTHGRGLICAPLSEERCDELNLPAMVINNTSLHATPFTVSIDLLGHGCTTGISATDRALTARILADPSSTPASLTRPGHIFPLRAVKGGVRERPGHTEAAVDLCRLAGLAPVGVIAELVHDDGEMMRLDSLRGFAAEHGCPLISIEDLVSYVEATESRAAQISRVDEEKR